MGVAKGGDERLLTYQTTRFVNRVV